MLSILCYVYILVRLVIFSSFPEIVYFPHGLDFSVAEINRGLAQFTIFLTLFFSGILVFNKKNNKVDYLGGTKNFKFIVFGLFLIFLLIITLEYEIFSRKDVSVYSLSINENVNLPIYIKVLTVFLSADVFLFLIIYFFHCSLNSNSVCNFDKRIIFTITLISIFTYVFTSSMLGSRGSSVRIVLFCIALYLILKNDKNQVNIFFRSMVLIIVAVTLNLFLFSTAERFRSHYYNSAQTEMKVTQENDKPVLVQLFNRLGVLDYFLITLSKKINPPCAEKYLTFSYSMKVTANFIFHGDPFKDAKMKTPEIFGVCYGNKTVENMKRRTSEIWTLPGIAKYHFRSWQYIAVFFAGSLLTIGAIFIQNFKGDFSMICYGFYIFIAPYLSFFSMGIDHSINTAITFFLRLSFAIFILYFIKILEKRLYKN